jgi:RNA polymerase sigma-70 factor (ECF subfamily)
MGTAATAATMSSESDLLQQARSGDKKAGEELFVQYLQNSKSIQGLLRYALRNPEDREEILHEIYLQLITGRNLFRGDARLSTYVYQVARVTIFQKYRRENTLKRGKIFRRIAEPVDVADRPEASPEYFYRVKQARELILQMIQRLPDAYREALLLRVLDDYTYDEIAEKLKIPVNTVSTRIHKGKKLLSMIFKERGLSEVFDL